MGIELILLGVVAIVVVTDFILRGLKKKSSNDEDIPKIEDQFNEIIKENKFSYILSRKRNIIIFLLLTAMLKPVVHYVFFDEKSKVFDSKKIDLGSQRTFKDYNLKDSIGNLYKVEYYNSYTFVDFQSGKKSHSLDSDLKNNGGIFTSNGDQLYTDGKKVFMYTLKNLSFNEYLKQRFFLKPYIFMISFGIMLIFVLLFNDKIKAR
tara:strand:- start:302 stop:919 length:618 start_codon:yes stop_codon:yes gene_type:complete